MIMLEDLGALCAGEASYLVSLTLDAEECLLSLLVLSSVNKEVLYDVVLI